jgi:hypothetical protein
MEVAGAVTLVLVKLSSDDTVYVGDFVSDDDASSWVVLQHSVKDLIRAGKKNRKSGPGTRVGVVQRNQTMGSYQLPINHL